MLGEDLEEIHLPILAYPICGLQLQFSVNVPSSRRLPRTSARSDRFCLKTSYIGILYKS